MDQFFARLYALFASASITQAADGSLMIQSAPGRYLAWVLAFVVVLPIAVWCWRKGLGGRYAPGVAIASFAIPIIVVPGIAMESIRVAPDKITMTTGFWFAPTRYQIPLSDVDEIVATHRAVDQRMVPRHDTSWDFRFRSRDHHVLHLSDLFDASRGHIIEYLRQHGFRVHES
jgi:hypothetical protein